MKYISELEHPHLETISKKLKKMPKTEYNKKVSIRVLSKEIHFLKKRGYTFDQISEILCRDGVNIGLQAGVETFYLVTLTALIGLISQEDLSASAPTWHVAISLNPLSSVLRMWQAC